MVENDRTQIVFRPIPVNDPLLFFKLAEQSRSGQRCEQRELREFHPRLFNKVESFPEHLQAVIIKPEDKGPPDLDSVPVDAFNVTKVLVWPVYPFPSVT